MFEPRDAADVHLESQLHIRTHVVGPVPRDVVALAVGRELQRMRIAAGLTPSQAAKLVGCGPRHINAHERGNFAPRIDTLINYARAYHGSLLSFEQAVGRALAGQEP